MERAVEGNQLTSVTIGNGITLIEPNAFYKGSSANRNLVSITIDKSCSTIKDMYNYPWIGTTYRQGTPIYGANNEVCASW